MGRRAKGVIWTIIFVLIIGGMFYAYKHGLIAKLIGKKKVTVVAEESVYPVEVGVAAYRKLHIWFQESGNVVSFQDVKVFPKVNAETIKKILVDVGDKVRAGQVIAVIDDRTISAQLESTKAAYEASLAQINKVKASLSAVKKDKARIERLYKKKVVSQQQLDHIVSQYNQLLAGLAAAIADSRRLKAMLNQVKVHYDDYRVKAPISGVVSQRYQDPGDLAVPSMPLLRITKMNPLKVVFGVNEKKLRFVRRGLPVRIVVDAYPDKVFWGKVWKVSPVVDPMTRTATVEVIVSNEKGELKPGMYASVTMDVGRKKLLSVPLDAVKRISGTNVDYVLVVGKNGVVSRRKVITGIVDGDMVEISGNVKPGDKVIVLGSTAIREGSKVRIVKGD